MSHVQLLQAHHPTDGARQLPDELVEADIKNGEVYEQANLRWQARFEPIVKEHDLVQCPGHVVDAPGETATEPIIGKDDDGDQRVAEIVRDVEDEAVVVDENGIEILIEEGLGDATLELIVVEVDVFERREAEDDVGELASESVVAEIELEEEAEAVEGQGDGAAEAVGVDVEEGEVGEEVELIGEVASNVAVVEVDTDDDGEARVEGEGCAVDAGVVADAEAHSVDGEVEWVGDDGELQGLEGNVGVAEVGVGEGEGGIHRHVLPPELPSPDVAGLRVDGRSRQNR